VRLQKGKDELLECRAIFTQRIYVNTFERIRRLRELVEFVDLGRSVKRGSLGDMKSPLAIHIPVGNKIASKFDAQFAQREFFAELDVVVASIVCRPA
jgi:hypothetical protein